MKTGFPNPIEKTTHKSQRNPWNFDQPPYDERSSCYINTGSHHGVGHRQPVGHTGNPKQQVPCLPKNHRKGMQVSKIPNNNLRLEIDG